MGSIENYEGLVNHRQVRMLKEKEWIKRLVRVLVPTGDLR